MTDVIEYFVDEYRFLSNFSSHPVYFDGRMWPTTEHLFQSMKCTSVADTEQIRTALTPSMAKRLGRQVTLDPAWEELKIDAMLLVLRLKFTQHPKLRAALRRTGELALIEGNTWHDQFWGDCSCPRHLPINGENMLGILLMQVRKELS